MTTKLGHTGRSLSAWLVSAVLLGALFMANGGIAWKHIAEDITDRPISPAILAEIDRLIK